MTFLFDSSVLVAGVAGSHPRHRWALAWLKKAVHADAEGVIASHSLAETYSTLSVLPVKPRISTGLAWRLIQENTTCVKVVALTANDYRRAIGRLADSQMPGGAVYDALIARIAERLAVDRLVTLSPRHFKRVWPEGRQRIVAP